MHTPDPRSARPPARPSAHPPTHPCARAGDLRASKAGRDGERGGGLGPWPNRGTGGGGVGESRAVDTGKTVGRVRDERDLAAGDL